MADGGPEILYIAPSAPSRGAIAGYAAAYLAAIQSHGSMTGAALLGGATPEELDRRAGAIGFVKDRVSRALQSVPPNPGQILHAELGHHTQREFWAAQCAARLRPDVPLCVTFHDAPELPRRIEEPRLGREAGFVGKLVAPLSGWIARCMTGRLEAGFLARASVLICHSHHAGALLARRFPRHAHKVACCPPVVIGPAPPEGLEPNVRKEDEPVEITVFGFVRPGSGIEEFLRGLAAVGRRRLLQGRIRVRIRGRITQAVAAAGYEVRLRTWIGRLGMDEIVSLNPGAMRTDQLVELLRETDILVLPRAAGSCTGASLSLLAAMPWAVAVVASDAGGLPEFLENERDALVYPAGEIEMLADCLEQLIDEAKTRFRLAHALRQKALQRYAPEVVASVMAEVYEEVLAARAEKRRVQLPESVRLTAPGPAAPASERSPGEA